MNIISKTNPLRQITAVLLLVMLTFPLLAHEKADSTFVFRFLSGKDMFYSPGLNNGKELARMYACVDRIKDRIKSRKIMVYVDGYSSSKTSKAENLEIAKIRSNRVKSELITHKGLKEQNFITHNHAGQGNYVIVRFKVPKSLLKTTSKPPKKEQSKNVTEEPLPPLEKPEEIIETPEEKDTVNPDEKDIESPEEKTNEEDSTFTPLEFNNSSESSAPVEVISSDSTLNSEIPVNLSREKSDSRFALKTNLLYYAVLMPNVEVEWKFIDRWSAALEVQGAWYAKEDPHKVYRVATIIPEVRYWIKERSRWHGLYAGIFGGGGLYDLCNGKKGHEGEGFMVGASAGYMWPISKHLSLDAGLGIGYMRLRDKVYMPLDGHFLYQLTKNINYVGPLRLKLSLVWRIPK